MNTGVWGHCTFSYHKSKFCGRERTKRKKMKEYEDCKLNKNHFCWSFCVPILCYILLYSLIQLPECSEFELHLRKRVIWSRNRISKVGGFRLIAGRLLLHNNIEQDNISLARGVRGLACQYLKQVFNLCKAIDEVRIFCFCLTTTLIFVGVSFLQLGNTGRNIMKFGVNIMLLKISPCGNFTLRQYKHYGRL